MKNEERNQCLLICLNCKRRFVLDMSGRELDKLNKITNLDTHFSSLFLLDKIIKCCPKSDIYFESIKEKGEVILSGVYGIILKASEIANKRKTGIRYISKEELRRRLILYAL